MQDGTPWPGNNTKDHPGMIQVFLGHSGGFDVEGNELPRLVYVSREKRPGFQHHKKAGAMNALVKMTSFMLFIFLLGCVWIIDLLSFLQREKKIWGNQRINFIHFTSLSAYIYSLHKSLHKSMNQT